MLRELTARFPWCAGKCLTAGSPQGGRTGTPAAFSNFCGINALTVATLKLQGETAEQSWEEMAGAHPYVHYIPDLQRFNLNFSTL